MRRHSEVWLLVVALITATLQFRQAYAQQNEARVQTPSVKDSLSQNFLAQHEIGRRFQFDPAELPPPKTGAIVTNRPLTTPYSGQVPQVPSGFTATPFATGLVNPRRLLVLPNGDVCWLPSKVPDTLPCCVMMAVDMQHG
jgi:glucose/arabinose dehydrogenase